MCIRDRNTTQSNGQPSNTTATAGRLPIGFYTDEQRREQQGTATQTQPKSNTDGGKLLVLTKTYKETNYLDTFTIEHKGKRYRLTDVERFCRTYRDRLKQSERSGDTDTAERRRKSLTYWESRRAELLEKIEKAASQA